MKSDLSPRDWQMLSACLDHQLGTGEISRLKARLEIEPTLRQSLERLEQTKLILRSAPRRKTPRDFRLDPSTAPSKSIPVLFPLFSFASAVAVLLLVILVLSDSPSWLRQQLFQAIEEEAPVAVMMEGEISEEVLQTEDVERPPLIFWAAPYGPAMGMGGGGDSSAVAKSMDEVSAPAPPPNAASDQEENTDQPEEELPADMAAETPESTTESGQTPQGEEAPSQPDPVATESLAGTQPPQGSAEFPKQISEYDQTESRPIDTMNTGSETLPSGPILGIKPSSTPAQIAALSVEELEGERLSFTRSFLKWLFAAAALLFGLVAVLVWRNSQR